MLGGSALVIGLPRAVFVVPFEAVNVGTAVNGMPVKWSLEVFCRRGAQA